MKEPVGPEDRPEPKRRKRWRTVVAVLIVLVAIGGIVAYDHYFARFKRSEPYQMALESIQKDAKAKERLGTPIQDATSIFQLAFPGGFIDKERGDANLAFKVSGPKGKADVWVQALRIEGKWGLRLVKLRLPGDKEISIDTTAAGGVIAPKFDPTRGGGGVEPPKPNLSKTPPGKSGPGSKESAGPGPSLKIDVPDLDVK